MAVLPFLLLDLCWGPFALSGQVFLLVAFPSEAIFVAHFWKLIYSLPRRYKFCLWVSGHGSLDKVIKLSTTFFPYMCIIKEHCSYDVWQLVCSVKIKEVNVAGQEWLALGEHGGCSSESDWVKQGRRRQRFIWDLSYGNNGPGAWWEGEGPGRGINRGEGYVTY